MKVDSQFKETVREQVNKFHAKKRAENEVQFKENVKKQVNKFRAKK